MRARHGVAVEIAWAAGKNKETDSGLDQTNTRPVNDSATTQIAAVTSRSQSLIDY